jgi:hypothetical protein
MKLDLVLCLATVAYAAPIPVSGKVQVLGRRLLNTFEKYIPGATDAGGKALKKIALMDAPIPGVIRREENFIGFLGKRKSIFYQRLEAMNPAKRLDYLGDYLYKFRTRVDKWDADVVELDGMNKRGVDYNSQIWKMWKLKFTQEHKPNNPPDIEQVLTFARKKVASEKKIYQSREVYFRLLNNQINFEDQVKGIDSAGRLAWMRTELAQERVRLTGMKMDADLFSSYREDRLKWNERYKETFSQFSEQCKREQLWCHDPQFDEVLSFLRHKAALKTVIYQNRLKYYHYYAKLQRLKDDVVALEMFEQYSKENVAPVPQALIKWGDIWQRENPTAGNPTTNQVLELAKRALESAEKNGGPTISS